MTKKIIHLLTGTSFSGAENVACQIMACFKDIGEYRMLYCSPNGPIKKALQERSIQFVPLEKWSLSEVRRMIQEEKPDIIHAHDMKASFYAALVCGKIPLVSHVHNNNIDSRALSLKSILYYYAAKKAKHIFWVSKSAYEGYAFHDKLKEKSTILYNVINADEVYQKLEKDKNNYKYDIVYVGRLTYQKNPQRLIEILVNVTKKHPGMKAAIVGSGELEAEIKQKIFDLHAENYIDMLGYSNNPYKIMKSAKIMLMTSRWEGLPMCALEAMALGVPIVSTPTDGLKEVIDDAKTGFLSDEDEVIIDRCVDILEKDELYKKLHQATLNKADEILDIKSYKESLDKVYRQIL